MAWLEAHQALATHRKLYALAGALKVSRVTALGHLMFLWFWALDNAPEGDLTGIDPHVIKLAADWPKKPETLIDALREAGWIDDDPMQLHDWDDYAGKLRDRRERNKEAMRAARAKHVTTRVKLPTEQTKQTQPTAPTQPTVARVAREVDAGFALAFTAFENLAGSVGPTIIDKISGELEDGTQPEWIVAACEEAALHNGRSWAYVAKILENWKRKGFKAERKGGANAGRNGRSGLDPYADLKPVIPAGKPAFDARGNPLHADESEAPAVDGIRPKAGAGELEDLATGQQESVDLPGAGGDR